MVLTFAAAFSYSFKLLVAVLEVHVKKCPVLKHLKDHIAIFWNVLRVCVIELSKVGLKFLRLKFFSALKFPDKGRV